MPERDEPAAEKAPEPSTEENDSEHWRHMMYTPTPEDRENWEKAGVPPESELVGGFLGSNPLVWGVPDKAEVYRMAQSVTGSQLDPDEELRTWMHLRVARPAMGWQVLTHPHLTGFGDVMEHNFNVRLMIVTVEMVLTRIRVLHGSKTDDSKAIVFEGDEYPGAAWQRNLRVIRVTVNEEGVATHEVVASTVYQNFGI